MIESFALLGINPEAIAGAGIWIIALIIFANTILIYQQYFIITHILQQRLR